MTHRIHDPLAYLSRSHDPLTHGPLYRNIARRCKNSLDNKCLAIYIHLSNSCSNSMAEKNTTSNDETFGQNKNKSITCIVCKKSGCSEKYRRHLSTHVTSGALTADEVNKITFHCRITRCDMKEKRQDKIQLGYSCHYTNDLKQECGHIVVDLKRHLTSFHKLDRFCSLFEDLVEKGLSKKPAKRKISSTTHVRASEQNELCRKRISISQGMGDSIAKIPVEPTSSNNFPDTQDIFTFDCETNSDSDSDDLLFESTFVPPREDYFTTSSISSLPSSALPSGESTNLCFIDTEKITGEFQSFMHTKGGGGRRHTPVKGDISSFRCLVKEVGWENFWDPNVLNNYTSSASCSPSTSYGRLRVYERFVHFLRTRFPILLPSPERMVSVESMIKALKEALGKDRHYRSKLTMTASRNRMPHSLRVLRQWRAQRNTVEVKTLFPVSTSNETFKLDENLFIKLRNFLIVEIILNSAQRSGIIEGMLIQEVLDAKDNANEDNLHYMYIEEHKTGHIQPAIIYLNSEIFNYLLIFIEVVIPQLPQMEDSRHENGCRVFQTWKSIILHSSNVNHCFRAGLLLFGIEDPHGCPTHYRKAASTLISMHKPELQESLSQFMCHSRSTTEKHYRTHMAHKGMYTIFQELGMCQAITGDEAEHVTTPPKPCSSNTESDSEDGTIVDSNIEVDILADINAPEVDLVTPLAEEFTDEISCREEQSLPKYYSRWNKKSIFLDQREEDIFFRVFEGMVDDSIALRTVCRSDVCSLGQNSDFSYIWQRLIEHLGYQSACKKVTDKIRTFGRNHRKI